jgi:hypothetical protein
VFKRKLPTGVKEFHAWADRIISRSGLPATPDSQKFALANMLMQVDNTVASAPDKHFVNMLRKSAINQVADHIRSEIRDAAKARLTQQAEATAPQGASGEAQQEA